MPLFDAYIMTDWSGGSRRRRNRQDAIWIAHGDIDDDSPQAESPPSRTDAIELIRSLLRRYVTSKSRVLVCFDFAYGYPVDFAAALESATGKSDLPWRLVWQYLSEIVKDDMGTLPNRLPSNSSNRFEVANLINSALSTSSEAAGPFWCSAEEAAYLHIPQRQPEQPFVSAQGYLIKPLRLTDKRAKSGTPFRLFGTASVGGQSITGIPRLHQLRNEPELLPRSAIWPFETGWHISVALILVLERLSPLERASFLLHDVFGVDFAEVARALGRGEAACRQLAARARAHILAAQPRFPATREEGSRLAAAFREAVASGDVQRLSQLLAEDAVLYPDGGGKRPAPLKPIYGAEKILRFFAGIARNNPSLLAVQMRPATVNGLAGFVMREVDGSINTIAFEPSDARIAAIYLTRNPEKLRHINF
jgi:RNA polymerase sigma-70 factor, ECF subfamily